MDEERHPEMINRHLLAEEYRLLAVETFSQLSQKPMHLLLWAPDAAVIDIAPDSQLASSMSKNGLLVLALDEPRYLDSVDLLGIELTNPWVESFLPALWST